METRNRIIRILAWAILIIGMGYYLFSKDNSVKEKTITIACCLIAGVLFWLGRKQ